MPARRTRKPAALALQGSLWITAGERSLGGHGRMALLRTVNAQGSITQAAKTYGMSYKAAWDAVDAMNTLAGEPLVERVTGGRGGGSTRLTPHGLKLLERYEQVDAVHQRFLRLLDAAGMNLDQEFSLLKVLQMKTSARNQWSGSVSALRAGAVNDEVEVLLPGGSRLTALVTRDSTEALSLRPRKTVIALVKSQAVLLATGLGEARLSTSNRFEGLVKAVTPGALHAEVTVEVPGGMEVVATVAQPAVGDLGLAPGEPVVALFKASDVVLAVID
jgi:molybdate transport system regulatory protein